MTFKSLLPVAMALAFGAATLSLSATETQAKCKFGCGLAIGLGAGILGSAIVRDSNRGSRGYDDDYYRSPPPRVSRGCRSVHRACESNWGYGNSDYYGCMRYEGC
jgi:hypothetical protein